MSRSNFYQDCRSKDLEKVWLQKNRNSGMSSFFKIVPPIGSQVNEKGKLSLKFKNPKFLKNKTTKVTWKYGG